MSARESWTKRLTQRTERAAAAPSGTPARTAPMNTMHRCDRCGARAYVRVLLRSQQELLFCAHHYGQHTSALAKVAVGIRDESGRLLRGE